MRQLLTAAFAAILVLIAVPLAKADPGLMTKTSAYSVSETLDRLEAVLAEQGMKIFARIDHAAGAASVDLELRPTETLIFGNPKAGTPLMQSDQRIAIDLPLKAVAYEAADGTVYLAVNDPGYLADRFGITDRDEGFARMGKALGNFTDAATK